MIAGTVVCDGAAHTLRYDGQLVLVDHDLERDLAFQALRDQPPEGCLGVRDAWHGIGRSETSWDFLEAMLLDDVDVRCRMVKEVKRTLAFAPQIALAIGKLDKRPRVPFEQRCRWQLVLLDLSHPLRLAFCRSLEGELAELDDHQLRVALIGEERMADVLPFVRRSLV